jgi:hypothetical protein
MNNLLIIAGVILTLVVSSLPNDYAAADSSKKTWSSSLTNILGFDPNAKDSTGTTLFEAAASPFISKCNETASAQSDVTNALVLSLVHMI